MNCVIPLWGGATSSHLHSPGSIQATRLPLGKVNLLGMHIIPLLTINAGTHFTYLERDGGLSQTPARLSWEWVLNPGPVTWWSTALPTELSQLDTGATISCIAKACFKVQNKPKIVQTNIYKVNSANGNSLGPIGTTMHTLKFHKKFQQQFTICKNLLWPVILGLDFSLKYLIGTDGFSFNQLHLHQWSKSIVISDPAPFLLHVNQISTFPQPHILI